MPVLQELQVPRHRPVLDDVPRRQPDIPRARVVVRLVGPGVQLQDAVRDRDVPVEVRQPVVLLEIPRPGEDRERREALVVLLLRHLVHRLHPVVGQVGRPPDDVVERVRHLQPVLVAQDLPLLHQVPRHQHPVAPEIEVRPLRQTPVPHLVRQVDEVQELLPHHPPPDLLPGQMVHHPVVHHPAQRPLAPRQRHLRVHLLHDPPGLRLVRRRLRVVPGHGQIDPPDAPPLLPHHLREGLARPRGALRRAPAQQHHVPPVPERVVDRPHLVPVPARIVVVRERVEVHPQMPHHRVGMKAPGGHDRARPVVLLRHLAPPPHLRALSDDPGDPPPDLRPLLPVRRHDQRPRQVGLQAQIFELWQLQKLTDDVVGLLLPSLRAAVFGWHGRPSF